MSAKIPGKPRGDKSTHKHLSNQFQYNQSILIYRRPLGEGAQLHL